MYQYIVQFLGLESMHYDSSLIVVICGVAFIVVLLTVYDILMMVLRFIFGGK